jgi:hypothetical protein
MVEHDQIVTAEAHRDRLTALGERRASTSSAFIEAHAQPGDRAEEGQVLDRVARMYHVRSNSRESCPPTTENSALFDAASGAAGSNDVSLGRWCRITKHTIGRWAPERQHEPPGGPEFESALNQRIRVGAACDKGVWPFEAATRDGRSAQIAVIPGRLSSSLVWTVKP